MTIKRGGVVSKLSMCALKSKIIFTTRAVEQQNFPKCLLKKLKHFY